MTNEERRYESMLVYRSNWYGKDSFRMLPISEDCPFLEVIFDPSTKVLAVIGKSKKDKPQMAPKLNSKGQPITVKSAEGTAGLAEERLVFESYYEYYIDDPDDIIAFVKMYAMNFDHPAVSIFETIFEEEKVEK
jgi:hypothetical protein